MKKLVHPIISLIILSLGCGVAFAASGVPSGKHYTVNIIGAPKNVKPGGGNWETSNGASIFIPLKNATGPNQITCEAEKYIFTDDEGATFTTQEPAGARIYFKAGDTFDILDRDATDSDGATIQIPVDQAIANDETANPDSALLVDIYIRVLGKPSTCMDINAYAFDGEYYFWAGSVDVNRKTGKSTWLNVNELFDVHYCQVVDNACVVGTEVELSVFNDVFESYFWSILNNGTRLVQMRLIPRT